MKGVEASVDGVLGGYGHVNDADIIGSEVFLKTLLQERLVNGETNQHLVALGTLLFFFYTCVSLKITQLHLQIVDLALEGSPRIF